MAKKATPETTPEVKADKKFASFDEALLWVRQEVVLVANQKNPLFQSRYLDFNGLIDAVFEPFRRAGIDYRFSLRVDGDNQLLSLRLSFRGTGEHTDDTLLIPREEGFGKGPGTMQKTVASVTYGKRCLLVTALGLPVERDDDGNSTRRRVDVEALMNAAELHAAMRAAKTIEELRAAWEGASPAAKKDPGSVPLRDQMKAKLTR